jgi:hypothetical protein
MEIQRTAAASTYVVFPMLSNTGVPQTGLTVVGSWLAWADTARPASQSFRPLSGSTVEIDVSGVYQCPLASTELPAASPYVMCRFATAGIATQYLLIRTATLFANVQAVTAGAITAGAFANGAITAAVVADGTIDAATFAAGAIDATAIADGAIDAATFAAGAINAAAIATDAITAAKIAADAIGASELAADAVTEIQAAVAAGAIASISAGGISAASFAAGAIDASAIAANAIGASELAADGGSEYADAFLGRTIDRSGSGGRTVGQALMVLRDKVSISGGTMTVTGVDDVTTEWTATIATQAVTAIVTSIDPA